MNGKFDVIDEWGKKIGEYFPTGEGGNLTILGLLLFLISLPLLVWYCVTNIVWTFYRHIKNPTGLEEEKKHKMISIVVFLLVMMCFCCNTCSIDPTRLKLP